MARLIGLGPAEKLLQYAVMLAPAEAKAVGLIDDVAPRDGLLVRSYGGRAGGRGEDDCTGRCSGC